MNFRNPDYHIDPDSAALVKKAKYNFQVGDIVTSPNEEDETVEILLIKDIDNRYQPDEAYGAWELYPNFGSYKTWVFADAFEDPGVKKLSREDFHIEVKPLGHGVYANIIYTERGYTLDDHIAVTETDTEESILNVYFERVSSAHDIPVNISMERNAEYQPKMGDFVYYEYGNEVKFLLLGGSLGMFPDEMEAYTVFGSEHGKQEVVSRQGLKGFAKKVSRDEFYVTISSYSGYEDEEGPALRAEVYFKNQRVHDHFIGEDETEESLIDEVYDRFVNPLAEKERLTLTASLEKKAEDEWEYERAEGDLYQPKTGDFMAVKYKGYDKHEFYIIDISDSRRWEEDYELGVWNIFGTLHGEKQYAAISTFWEKGAVVRKITKDDFHIEVKTIRDVEGKMVPTAYVYFGTQSINWAKVLEDEDTEESIIDLMFQEKINAVSEKIGIPINASLQKKAEGEQPQVGDLVLTTVSGEYEWINGDDIVLLKEIGIDGGRAYYDGSSKNYGITDALEVYPLRRNDFVILSKDDISYSLESAYGDNDTVLIVNVQIEHDGVKAQMQNWTMMPWFLKDDDTEESIRQMIWDHIVSILEMKPFQGMHSEGSLQKKASPKPAVGDWLIIDNQARNRIEIGKVSKVDYTWEGVGGRFKVFRYYCFNDGEWNVISYDSKAQVYHKLSWEDLEFQIYHRSEDRLWAVGLSFEKEGIKYDRRKISFDISDDATEESVRQKMWEILNAGAQSEMNRMDEIPKQGSLQKKADQEYEEGDIVFMHKPESSFYTYEVFAIKEKVSSDYYKVVQLLPRLYSQADRNYGWRSDQHMGHKKVTKDNVDLEVHPNERGEPYAKLFFDSKGLWSTMVGEFDTQESIIDQFFEHYLIPWSEREGITVNADLEKKAENDPQDVKKGDMLLLKTKYVYDVKIVYVLGELEKFGDGDHHLAYYAWGNPKINGVRFETVQYEHITPEDFIFNIEHREQSDQLIANGPYVEKGQLRVTKPIWSELVLPSDTIETVRVKFLKQFKEEMAEAMGEDKEASLKKNAQEEVKVGDFVISRWNNDIGVRKVWAIQAREEDGRRMIRTSSYLLNDPGDELSHWHWLDREDDNDKYDFYKVTKDDVYFDIVNNPGEGPIVQNQRIEKGGITSNELIVGWILQEKDTEESIKDQIWEVFTGQSKFATQASLTKTAKAIDKLKPLPTLWYENEKGEKVYPPEDCDDVAYMEMCMHNYYPFQVLRLPVLKESICTNDGYIGGGETTLNCIDEIVLYLMNIRKWRLTDAITVAASSCSRCLNILVQEAGGEIFPQDERDKMNTHCELCEIVDPKYDKKWKEREEAKEKEEADSVVVIIQEGSKDYNFSDRIRKAWKVLKAKRFWERLVTAEEEFQVNDLVLLNNRDYENKIGVVLKIDPFGYVMIQPVWSTAFVSSPGEDYFKITPDKIYLNVRMMPGSGGKTTIADLLIDLPHEKGLKLFTHNLKYNDTEESIKQEWIDRMKSYPSGRGTQASRQVTADYDLQRGDLVYEIGTHLLGMFAFEHEGIYTIVNDDGVREDGDEESFVKLKRENLYLDVFKMGSGKVSYEILVKDRWGDFVIKTGYVEEEDTEESIINNWLEKKRKRLTWKLKEMEQDLEINQDDMERDASRQHGFKVGDEVWSHFNPGIVIEIMKHPSITNARVVDTHSEGITEISQYRKRSRDQLYVKVVPIESDRSDLTAIVCFKPYGLEVELEWYELSDEDTTESILDRYLSEVNEKIESQFQMLHPDESLPQKIATRQEEIECPHCHHKFNQDFEDLNYTVQGRFDCPECKGEFSAWVRKAEGESDEPTFVEPKVGDYVLMVHGSFNPCPYFVQNIDPHPPHGDNKLQVVSWGTDIRYTNVVLTDDRVAIFRAEDIDVQVIPSAIDSSKPMFTYYIRKNGLEFDPGANYELDDEDTVESIRERILKYIRTGEWLKTASVRIAEYKPQVGDCAIVVFNPIETGGHDQEVYCIEEITDEEIRLQRHGTNSWWYHVQIDKFIPLTKDNVEISISSKYWSSGQPVPFWNFVFKAEGIEIEGKLGKRLEDGDTIEDLKEKAFQLQRFGAIKTSSSISYNPDVNTDHSIERNRTYDWLNIEERNRKRQKTKRWDRQSFPEDANGGYDQVNKFNDADQTVVSPTASFKKAERKAQPGDIVEIYYDGYTHWGVVLRIEGNRAICDGRLPEDMHIGRFKPSILRKISKDEIEFEIIGAGKDSSKPYVMCQLLKDIGLNFLKYKFPLGGKETEETIREKIYQMILDALVVNRSDITASLKKTAGELPFDEEFLREYQNFLVEEYYGKHGEEYDPWEGTSFYYGNCTQANASFISYLAEHGHSSKVYGMSQEELAKHTGFKEMYNFDDNGHDWLVIDDRYLLDIWAADYLGAKQILFDMQDPAQAEYVRKLYGDRQHWEYLADWEQNPRVSDELIEFIQRYTKGETTASLKIAKNYLEVGDLVRTNSGSPGMIIKVDENRCDLATIAPGYDVKVLHGYPKRFVTEVFTKENIEISVSPDANGNLYATWQEGFEFGVFEVALADEDTVETAKDKIFQQCREVIMDNLDDYDKEKLRGVHLSSLNKKAEYTMDDIEIGDIVTYRVGSFMRGGVVEGKEEETRMEGRLRIRMGSTVGQPYLIEEHISHIDRVFKKNDLGLVVTNKKDSSGNDRLYSYWNTGNVFLDQMAFEVVQDDDTIETLQKKVYNRILDQLESKLERTAAKEEVTQEEKLEYFKKRTQEHIDRVKANAKKLEEAYPEELKGLVEQTESHDQSKFEDPELTPYIELTWKKKVEKVDGGTYEVSQEVQDQITEVTIHHVKNNKHHAEAWSDQEKDIINTQDRDAPPDNAIDASKMEPLYLAEMVADWTAMSQEFKEGNAKGWADKNIGERWKFTPEQQELIYKWIDVFPMKKSAAYIGAKKGDLVLYSHGKDSRGGEWLGVGWVVRDQEEDEFGQTITARIQSGYSEMTVSPIKILEPEDIIVKVEKVEKRGDEEIEWTWSLTAGGITTPSELYFNLTDDDTEESLRQSIMRYYGKKDIVLGSLQKEAGTTVADLKPGDVALIEKIHPETEENIIGVVLNDNPGAKNKHVIDNWSLGYQGSWNKKWKAVKLSKEDITFVLGNYGDQIGVDEFDIFKGNFRASLSLSGNPKPRMLEDGDTEETIRDECWEKIIRWLSEMNREAYRGISPTASLQKKASSTLADFKKGDLLTSDQFEIGVIIHEPEYDSISEEYGHFINSEATGGTGQWAFSSDAKKISKEDLNINIELDGEELVVAYFRVHDKTFFPEQLMKKKFVISDEDTEEVVKDRLYRKLYKYYWELDPPLDYNQRQEDDSATPIPSPIQASLQKKAEAELQVGDVILYQDLYGNDVQTILGYVREITDQGNSFVISFPEDSSGWSESVYPTSLPHDKITKDNISFSIKEMEGEPWMTEFLIQGETYRFTWEMSIPFKIEEEHTEKNLIDLMWNDEIMSSFHNCEHDV